MPRGDRTGPAGQGPRTGRAAGYCAGNEAPGFAVNDVGGGFGAGGGRGRGAGGRGRRNMFHATGLPGWMRFARSEAPDRPSGAELEKQALRNQAEALEMEVSHIRQRLAALERDGAAE